MNKPPNYRGFEVLQGHARFGQLIAKGSRHEIRYLF